MRPRGNEGVDENEVMGCAGADAVRNGAFRRAQDGGRARRGVRLAPKVWARRLLPWVDDRRGVASTRARARSRGGLKGWKPERSRRGPGEARSRPHVSATVESGATRAGATTGGGKGQNGGEKLGKKGDEALKRKVGKKKRRD